ncbi:MAG: O-antigen translocase [Dysgonomonas sp.]
MKKNNASYNQIIKTTAIFGGSQVLVVLIGLVRTKIIAVLLGPVGIGLISIYQSLTDLIRSACLLGMDTAVVKEVAEATVEENKDVLFKTISRFNKWFNASALIALFACIVFCYPISLWVFDDSKYAIHIAILSVSISMLVLATGKSAILQGMRRISEMAKAAVLGGFIGLLATIPVYYFWRLDGIIPALIINSIIGLLCAEYYYRRQGIKKVALSNREAFNSGLDTLKLGIYIIVSGFIATLSMFAIRAFISRNIDVDAAGLFQASWVITNVYFGIILRAMGSDFFPRLSAISQDENEFKKLANEQSYIVLALTSPVIVVMLLFSEPILSLLYSSQFVYADTVLQWQLLGAFFKIVTWPISFILLAKNRGFIFLITEIIFYGAYLLSAYLLFPRYGLEAAGIGYFVAYTVYLPVMFFTCRSISNFGWNKSVGRMILINLFLVAASFYITFFHKGNMLLCTAIMAISFLYTYFRLKKVFSVEDLKNWFRKKG